jgi:PhnB protein
LDGLKKWLSTWSDGPHYKTKDRVVIVEGGMALVYGLVYMAGKRKDGQTTDMWYRETSALKKEGDDWKIIHSHESVPFYMDSENKAALDLKPN